MTAVSKMRLAERSPSGERRGEEGEKMIGGDQSGSGEDIETGRIKSEGKPIRNSESPRRMLPDLYRGSCRVDPLEVEYGKTFMSMT
jgi:hypothetical protein